MLRPRRWVLRKTRRALLTELQRSLPQRMKRLVAGEGT